MLFRLWSGNKPPRSKTLILSFYMAEKMLFLCKKVCSNHFFIFVLCYGISAGKLPKRCVYWHWKPHKNIKILSVKIVDAMHTQRAVIVVRPPICQHEYWFGVYGYFKHIYLLGLAHEEDYMRRKQIC